MDRGTYHCYGSGPLHRTLLGYMVGFAVDRGGSANMVRRQGFLCFLSKSKHSPPGTAYTALLPESANPSLD
jgi:hypothetical protein